MPPEFCWFWTPMAPGYSGRYSYFIRLEMSPGERSCALGFHEESRSRTRARCMKAHQTACPTDPPSPDVVRRKARPAEGCTGISLRHRTSFLGPPYPLQSVACSLPVYASHDGDLTTRSSSNRLEFQCPLRAHSISFSTACFAWNTCASPAVRAESSHPFRTCLTLPVQDHFDLSS